MRRDLGGHAQAAGLGLAQHAHRAQARDVRHVVAGAGRLGEEQVARDDHVLGDARPAAQPEPRRDRAFVHLRAGREVVVLAVLENSRSKVRAYSRARAHHGRVHHATPVVADADRAGVAQVGHLGELFAVGCRPSPRDRVEPRAAGRTRARQHHLGDRARVVDRLGVRHRADVVKPPAAAARRPLAMSSLYSWPGSRRWACRSTKPGTTQHPAASITRTRSP